MIKLKKKSLFLVFLNCVSIIALTLTSFLYAYAQESTKTLSVRVAVLNDVKIFQLSVRGQYRLSDAKTNRLLKEGKILRKSEVASSVNGITLGAQEYTTSKICIEPLQDATIYVNGRRFRGTICIFQDQKKKLLVVNTVELENYIKGVLYHEVSHWWPIEAIKAQAVATRTYALYRMKENGGKNFDVTNDIYSQVYGGRNSERYQTNAAVEQTKGLILIYQGKMLPAYFHATCAGITENASNLWKIDLPPLRGVVCNFCKFSPHYEWKKNLQLKSIQETLNQNGYNLWLIKDIAVLKRNPSGRIETLVMTTRDGKTTTISGKDFRNIIGPNLIRSNDYEIVMKGYYMDLTGKGWGHGVGLCQWGAYGMAKENYKFDEILKHYYPGATIKRYEVTGF